MFSLSKCDSFFLKKYFSHIYFEECYQNYWLSNSHGMVGMKSPGLLMNILHEGDKSPVQRGFFTNSVGNLLPTLWFLGGLYNFCNFVFMFSLIMSWWYVEVATYLTDLEMIEYYQKTCRWNRSLWKLKTTS